MAGSKIGIVRRDRDDVDPRLDGSVLHQQHEPLLVDGGRDGLLDPADGLAVRGRVGLGGLESRQLRAQGRLLALRLGQGGVRVLHLTHLRQHQEERHQQHDDAPPPMPAKSGARLPPTGTPPRPRGVSDIVRQVDAAAERVQAAVRGPSRVALENHGFTQPLTDSRRVSQLARLSKPSAAPPAVNDADEAGRRRRRDGSRRPGA